MERLPSELFLHPEQLVVHRFNGHYHHCGRFTLARARKWEQNVALRIIVVAKF